MMATTSKRLIRLKRPRILRISALDAEVARKCDGIHMQGGCGDLRSPRRTVKVRPTLERGPPYIGTRSALHWNEVRPTLERGPPYIVTVNDLYSAGDRRGWGCGGVDDRVHNRAIR